MADTNKDTVIQLENQGSVHISEDVVAAVAALAASECEGVGMMCVSGGGIDLLGKKALSKGVKITLAEDTVTVDVYITVAYGRAIPKAAQEVQTRIKESIESMTGLHIGGINIHGGGVVFGKENKEGKEGKK